MGALRRAAFSVLARASFGLDRAGRALACVAGGVLRMDDLSAVIARRWDRYGVRESVVLSGLWPWEEACYATALREGDRILLIGCGSGRDLIALLQRGHRVDGLEPSPRTAAICRAMLARLGLNAPVHVGRIEDYRPQGYDVFLFSWAAYGYIAQRGRRVAVLRRLKDALRPGGRIVLSYVARTEEPRRLPLRIIGAAAALTRAGWRPEPGDVVYLGDGGDGLHFEHQFGTGELEAEAAAAGLRVVAHQRGEDSTAVLAP